MNITMDELQRGHVNHKQIMFKALELVYGKPHFKCFQLKIKHIYTFDTLLSVPFGLQNGLRPNIWHSFFDIGSNIQLQIIHMVRYTQTNKCQTSVFLTLLRCNVQLIPNILVYSESVRTSNFRMVQFYWYIS